mgnify:CR=1 FL=1
MAYQHALAARNNTINDRVSAANTVFRIWAVIYGLVGMQMGWILRPFIGHPDSPFELLCARNGNVFMGMWHAIERLFGA